MNIKYITAIFTAFMLTILCASAYVSVPTITDGIGFQYENITIGNDRIQIGDTNITKEATFVIAALDSLHKEGADFICNETNAATIIDTAVDLAAASGGGRIMLMAGTYTGRFYIDQPNIVLEGQGMYNTVLRLPNGVNVEAQTLTIVADNVTVRNLEVDGNRDNQTIAGIVSYSDGIAGYGDHITIEHCYVHDTMSHGIIFWEVSTGSCDGAPNAVRGTRGWNRCNKVLFNSVENVGNPTYISYSIDSAFHTKFFEVIGNHVKGDGSWSGGIGYHGGRNDIIANNIIRNAVGGGISINEANNIVVSGNTIDDFVGTSAAIYVYYKSKNIIITGNSIHNSSAKGIHVLGTAIDPITSVLITDNIVDTTAEPGMIYQYASFVNMQSNMLKDAGTYGLRLTNVDDGFIQNNIIKSFATGGGGFGISVGTSNRTSISNNRVRDPGTGGGYGIHIETAALDCMVFENYVSGASIDNIHLDAPANVMCRNNKGWITENSGTATLVSGTTSIAVTHGLDVTPSASDIMVTAMESLGSASYHYIDAYTSTTFNVTVNVDPTQDVDFAWSAIVL